MEKLSADMQAVPVNHSGFEKMNNAFLDASFETYLNSVLFTDEDLAEIADKLYRMKNVDCV